MAKKTVQPSEELSLEEIQKREQIKKDLEAPFDPEAILEVRHLRKAFPIKKNMFGKVQQELVAVDDVSFKLKRGETLGIVGESGCGKTTMGRTILKLHPSNGGQIIFDGQDITNYKPSEMRDIRREMQIIFQDPYSSLPPRSTVGGILTEPVQVHKIVPKEEMKNYVLELMDKCGLRDYYYERYPHEFLKPDGSSYTYVLGRPLQKFHEKDIRKKSYVYYGKKKFEGMFLMGTLVNPNTGKACVGSYDYAGEIIELVDQIAPFKQLGKSYVDVSQLPSDMYSGEENSGVRLVKYPTPNLADEAYRWNPDWVVIRLAEVYYMLAECKYRDEDLAGAAQLFNEVRRRNFTSSDPDPVTEGNIDKYRILDEWMREFIGEGRRRTDLIRWGVFLTDTWWDHNPSLKEHLKLFPIPTSAMSSSNIIKQNPGY